MALNLPPPTRVAIGSLTVQGQKLELYLDPEWARYFTALNTQVVAVSGAVGQPGAPGTTGAAGVGVSLSDDAGTSVEFIPGPTGNDGPSGPAGFPLFLLQDQAEGQELQGKPTCLDETFIAPTLLNSWVNHSVTYNNAGYYRDSAGVVHLHGMVKDGVFGSPIFNLPAGYRPARNETFACMSNNAFGRMEVTSGGDVTLLVGSNLFASLDGMTFRASGAY